MQDIKKERCTLCNSQEGTVLIGKDRQNLVLVATSARLAWVIVYGKVYLFSGVLVRKSMTNLVHYT